MSEIAHVSVIINTKVDIVGGVIRPSNSIFSENYLLYKLVAKKLDLLLSKLQISNLKR